MKIGVLADTHIHDLATGFALAEKLLKQHFKAVDLVIHAGDHVHPELELCFAPLPFYAVRGNMDNPSPGLPEKRILRLAGKTIGVVHGWGPVQGIEERVLTYFSHEPLDALIFGHSHQPVCRRQGPLLLMNPGSPTDRRSAPFHSVGILQLEQNEIRGEILPLPEENPFHLSEHTS